jgi:DNA-binding transcriptional LysR family regulator
VRIEQLRYVAAVARLGSYRKAAQSLHISQPALSESVRSLERELGVELLERGRQGARLSAGGRDLLQHVTTVLDAVDRLRQAAQRQHQVSRVVRIGAMSTVTVSLLAPVIRQFRQAYPLTQVEVAGGLDADVQRRLLEGRADLGLVNFLDGDDLPPELETTPLLRGRPVACLPAGSPLASQPRLTVSDLLSAPLIGLRPGYVMHRYLHRLLGDEPPAFSYCADGAEMGKLMVAEGLGITVLPDFSVMGDPLESRGVITWRPLAEAGDGDGAADGPGIQLAIQRPRSGTPSRAAADLHRLLRSRAQAAGPSPSPSPSPRPGGPPPEAT